MLRIVQMAEAEAAKDYYTAALARADYYVAGTEVVGSWRGRGADILRLRDVPVDQQMFGRMVDNLHPWIPGERLTARTGSNRRAGYDINFHPPKGVSIMHALAGDDRLQSAFLVAVRATMAEMERSMQVRVRAKGSADADRVTGNWVYGEFLHLTARPAIADGVPDPHMHCHCTVLNASYDEAEQRWKAGQFGSIKRDANYFEAAFHARLAKAVVELGYRIKEHTKYWELADLPESLVEKFSKRTGVIEKKAEELGVTNANAKDRLGAETRAAKSKSLTREALTHAWMAQLSDAELAALRAARLRASAPPQRRLFGGAATAKASVGYAVEHLFERQSVVSDRRIAEAALRHGVGRGIEVAEVWREIEQSIASGQVFRRQVDDQQLCTTLQAYEETSRCIDYARDGMGRYRTLAPAWEIRRPELLTSAAADQRAAIQHVLSSTDRVIAVRGRAGTGKTYATQEIAAALAAAGHRMQALAPTSKAVDVLRQEGFASADTIAQLLVNPQFQQSVAGSVLLVDEAGLLSSRQLDQLFRVAGEQNCRVLLQYDLSQHRAVERGSPVRDLERYAGLRAAEIHVVRRQKRADYKAAVNDLAHGKIDKAFERLTAMNAFFEGANAEERQQRLASDYLAATRKPGTKVLVISPTHREGDAVTKAIRLALLNAGRLKAEEHETLTLQRSGLTAAQRGESIHFLTGLVIQFTQNTSSHRRGDRLVVKERLPDGTVLVQRSAPSGLGAGDAFALDLADKESFEVYNPKAVKFSVGDRIRITANGYVPVVGGDGSGSREDGRDGGKSKSSRGGKKKAACHRLINNAMYEIVRVTKTGDFLLNNGWVLPRSYGHLTHGYCTTSHASQGMTADTVLISQSAESFGASSREQFYVSASRGKTGIKIYTDSVAELARAVARSDQQPSAADLLAVATSQQQPLHPLPSIQASRSSADRARRREHTAATRALGDAKYLHIKAENGVPVIASLKHTPLQTGVENTQPVIISKDQIRYVDSVFEQGRWVCGPRHPVESHLPYTAEGGPSSLEKACEISVGSSALLTSPLSPASFHPEIDHHSQPLSI